MLTQQTQNLEYTALWRWLHAVLCVVRTNRIESKAFRLAPGAGTETATFPPSAFVEEELDSTTTSASNEAAGGGMEGEGCCKRERVCVCVCVCVEEEQEELEASDQTVRRQVNGNELVVWMQHWTEHMIRAMRC